jgi:hypothetical protein
MNHTQIEHRIEDACQRFDFSQSWRLWYHPRSWAEQRLPLVLSINPAATGSSNERWAHHGCYSQEAGSAFEVEDWGPRSLVQDPTPQYMKLAGLGVKEVAYANWVPFRTASSNDLTNHPKWRDINAWCCELWRDLLREMRPRLILCIGAIPRDGLERLLGKPDPINRRVSKPTSINGYTVTFRLDAYPKKRLRVVAVPYPSSRVNPLEDPVLSPIMRMYLNAITRVMS